MRSGLRRRGVVLWVVGLLVGLPLLTWGALAVGLRAGVADRWAQDRLTEALGVEVQLERLSLAGVLGLRAEGLRAGPGPDLEVDQLVLRPDWLETASMRRLSLGSVEVGTAVARLRRSPAGQLDPAWLTGGSPPSPEPDAPTGGPGSPPAPDGPGGAAPSTPAPQPQPKPRPQPEASTSSLPRYLVVGGVEVRLALARPDGGPDDALALRLAEGVAVGLRDLGPEGVEVALAASLGPGGAELGDARVRLSTGGDGQEVHARGRLDLGPLAQGGWLGAPEGGPPLVARGGSLRFDLRGRPAQGLPSLVGKVEGVDLAFELAGQAGQASGQVEVEPEALRLPGVSVRLAGAGLDARAAVPRGATGMPEVARAQGRVEGKGVPVDLLTSLAAAAGLSLPARGGQVDVDLGVQARADGLPEVEGSARLRGIEVALPTSRAPLVLEDLQVHSRGGWLDASGPVGLGGIRAQAETRLQLETGEVEARLEARPFGIPDLLPVLPAEVAAGLEGAPAEGRVEARLQLSGTQQAPVVSASVTPRGLKVLAPGSGRAFEVRGKGLQVDAERAELDVELSGPVEVSLAASLQPPSHAGQLQLAARTTRASLPALVALAGAPAGMKVEAGRVDAEVQVAGALDPAALRRAAIARVAADGVTIGTARGPVTLEEGRFGLRDGRLAIEASTWSLGGGQAKLAGEVEVERWLEGQPGPLFEGKVEVAGLEGEALTRLAGLDPGLGLERARFDGQVTLGRRPEGEGLAGWDLGLTAPTLALAGQLAGAGRGLVAKAKQLDLQGGELVAPLIFLESQGVVAKAQGRVQVTGDPSAKVKVWGRVSPDKVPGLPLGEVQTEGAVDFVLHHDGPLASLADARPRLESAGLRVSHPSLPAPVEWRSGTLEVRGAELGLQDLGLALASSPALPFRLKGRASAERVQVGLVASQLSAAAVAALAPQGPPFPLAGTLGLEVSVDGAPADLGLKAAQVRLDLAGLRATIPSPGGDMHLRLEGAPLELRDGVLRLDGHQVVADQGALVLSGELRPLEGLAASRVVARPRNLGLVFGPLTQPLRWETGSWVLEGGDLKVEDSLLALGRATQLSLRGTIRDLAGKGTLEQARVTGRLQLEDLHRTMELDPGRAYAGGLVLDLALTGDRVELRGEGKVQGDGPVVVRTLGDGGKQTAQVPVEGLRSQLRMDARSVNFADIRATVFGGSIVGGMKFEIAGPAPHPVTMDIKVDGVDLNRGIQQGLGLKGGLRGSLSAHVKGTGLGNDPAALKVGGPGSIQGLVVEGKSLGDQVGLGTLLFPESAPPPPPPPKRRGGLFGGFLDDLKGTLEQGAKQVVANVALKGIAERYFPGAETYLRGMMTDHSFPQLDLYLQVLDGWAGVPRFSVPSAPGEFEGRARVRLDQPGLDVALTSARLPVQDGYKVLVKDLVIGGTPDKPSLDLATVLDRIQLKAPPPPPPPPIPKPTPAPATAPTTSP